MIVTSAYGCVVNVQLAVNHTRLQVRKNFMHKIMPLWESFNLFCFGKAPTIKKVYMHRHVRYFDSLRSRINEPTVLQGNKLISDIEI